MKTIQRRRRRLIKQHFLCAILLFVFFGCVTVTEETKRPVKPKGNVPDDTLRELTNISQVRQSMTFEEVSEIMGRQLIVGYDVKKDDGRSLKSITIDSPYRIENVKRKKNELYIVAYYFTHVRKPDGIISEDELTPLVFHDNRLIGRGTNFLFRIKNKL